MARRRVQQDQQRLPYGQQQSQQRQQPPAAQQQTPVTQQQSVAKQKKQNTPLTVEEVIHKNRVRAESREEIKKFIGKIILVVLVIFLAFRYVWGIAIVENMDMAPALKDGDLILYFRLDRDFVLTDIVKYQVGGQEYYGRITAVAGDTVDISETGYLLVNGSLVDEEEIYYPMDRDAVPVDLPYVVEEGGVFVLGDYRSEATDSRQFGTISTEAIEGKIIGYFRRRGI